MTREELADRFQRHFGAGHVSMFRAPGRVNLIGEHTDYNLGFVLPIAIDLACYVARASSTDGNISIYSEERAEGRSWPVHSIEALKPERHWSDYFIGVAQGVLRSGHPLDAARYYIHSSVPEGSGLSSSAALEVASALALLNGRDIGRLGVAHLAQRAENDFVGNPCGIMDQYISVFGEEGRALKLDCRSLAHQLVTLPESVEICVVNSMVKHELAGSAYRERVRECQEAVTAIAAYFPDVKSLRDANLDQLGEVKIDFVAAKRARHIITENERVEQWIEAAIQNDPQTMGKLFIASHRSLRHDYQVSCAELDFLVEEAVLIDEVYGARMTGGGFGGCTVNLIVPGTFHAFAEKMSTRYQSEFGIVPAFHRCQPSNGAGELTD